MPRAGAAVRVAAWTVTTTTWVLAILRSGLGLVPLLRRSLSEVPPLDSAPLPSRRSALLFRAVVLARALRGRNDAAMAPMRWYLARARREVLAPTGAARSRPECRGVSEWRADELDRDRFHREVRRRPHPIVVRALNPLVRDWSLEALRAEFGESRVLANLGDRFALRALAELQPGSGSYVANSEQLLIDHPELVRELGVDRYAEWTGCRPYALQLFLGARRGTGLTFHCANNLNVFTMLHGRKRWTFVDPAHTYLMYPWLPRESGYVASILDYRGVPESYAELFAACPRREVVLEAGDVLVSPPWWWHRVENLDADTVGVASRWADPGAPDTNRLFSFAQLFSPELFHSTRATLESVFASRGSLEEAYRRAPRGRATAIEEVAHTRDQVLDPREVQAAWSSGPA